MIYLSLSPIRVDSDASVCVGFLQKHEVIENNVQVVCHSVF